MRRYLHKSTLIAAGLALVIGLSVGLIAGGLLHPAPAAHAIGINGALDIYPDGSLVVCTPALGCPQQPEPAGTCNFEGNGDAANCSFTLAPHDGGAIVQKDVSECFFIQPSGNYFTSFNSLVVYAPNGLVTVRCEH